MVVRQSTRARGASLHHVRDGTSHVTYQPAVGFFPRVAMRVFAGLAAVAALLFHAILRFNYLFTTEDVLANESILLVTAHPDDEAMFFGPTLTHITDPARGNAVHLLCLSSGNSEGLGSVRKEELIRAAALLGIPAPNVTIIDDETTLPDSMSAVWPAETVAAQIAATARAFDSSVILTFDAQGVSGHTNHKQVFWGALQYLTDIYNNHEAAWGSRKEARPILLSLTSVPIYRKYLAALDAMYTRLGPGAAGSTIVVSGPKDYQTTYTAMTNAHMSQMKWFRHLWCLFSRYMTVNDLVQVTPSSYANLA